MLDLFFACAAVAAIIVPTAMILSHWISKHRITPAERAVLGRNDIRLRLAILRAPAPEPTTIHDELGRELIYILNSLQFYSFVEWWALDHGDARARIYFEPIATEEYLDLCNDRLPWRMNDRIVILMATHPADRKHVVKVNPVAVAEWRAKRFPGCFMAIFSTPGAPLIVAGVATIEKTPEKGAAA